MNTEMNGKQVKRIWWNGANGDDEAEANARRIVACVNACAGIDTEHLEEAVLAKAEPALFAQNLMIQRDTLLEALIEAVSVIEDLGYESITGRAIIAKMEGEK